MCSQYQTETRPLSCPDIQEVMKYRTARIKNVERRHLINITECDSGIKIHQASLISLASKYISDCWLLGKNIV